MDESSIAEKAPASEGGRYKGWITRRPAIL